MERRLIFSSNQERSKLKAASLGMEFRFLTQKLAYAIAPVFDR
jgi:hypothetical protein